MWTKCSSPAHIAWDQPLSWYGIVLYPIPEMGLDMVTPRALLWERMPMGQARGLLTTQDKALSTLPSRPVFPLLSQQQRRWAVRQTLTMRPGAARAFHSISERGRMSTPKPPPNQETHVITLPPILHSEVDLFGAQALRILHGFSDHKTVTPTKKTKSVCLYQQFSQNTNACNNLDMRK